VQQYGYYRAMELRRLSILGVGLLGGSIGLAWKAISSDCHIIGYGHREDSLRRALEMGAVDQITQDPAAAVREADLVILCTPVGLFADILARIGPALAAGSTVTDVGSTKRSVVRLAAERLPAGVHFVGSHPMAGSEKRGVEYARADLFRGAVCIVTPEQQTNAGGLEQVTEFWKELGMRVTQLTPDEHDRLVADISHVPHAVAAALVAMQSDAAMALAGRGFLDATRIAGGDGGLWRDILVDNRDNVLAGIERLQGQLADLLKQLDEKDGQALKDWLDRAAATRGRWVRQKLQELNPD
jgi:prephenate dehydrogenase